jgi:hypothetical protein
MDNKVHIPNKVTKKKNTFIFLYVKFLYTPLVSLKQDIYSCYDSDQ